MTLTRISGICVSFLWDFSAGAGELRRAQEISDAPCAPDGTSSDVFGRGEDLDVFGRQIVEVTATGEVQEPSVLPEGSSLLAEDAAASSPGAAVGGATPPMETIGSQMMRVLRSVAPVDQEIALMERSEATPNSTNSTSRLSAESAFVDMVASPNGSNSSESDEPVAFVDVVASGPNGSNSSEQSEPVAFVDVVASPSNGSNRSSESEPVAKSRFIRGDHVKTSLTISGATTTSSSSTTSSTTSSSTTATRTDSNTAVGNRTNPVASPAQHQSETQNRTDQTNPVASPRKSGGKSRYIAAALEKSFLQEEEQNDGDSILEELAGLLDGDERGRRKDEIPADHVNHEETNEARRNANASTESSSDRNETTLPSQEKQLRKREEGGRRTTGRRRSLLAERARVVPYEQWQKGSIVCVVPGGHRSFRVL